jgi:hypothetical protein
MNDERDDGKRDETRRLTLEEIERLSEDEFDALPQHVKRSYFDSMTRENLPPLWEYYGYRSERDYWNEGRFTVPEYFGDDDAEGWTDGGESCDAPPMPSPEKQPREEPEQSEDPVRRDDIEDLFGPVISRYTRAQAVEDGVLVDVTEAAEEAGLRLPVALTRAVWAEYVAVPAGVEAQDEAGRLWDVLRMCRHGIGQGKNRDASEIRFQLHVRNDNRRGEPPLVTLKAVCGPDDGGRPCLTIMRPDED